MEFKDIKNTWKDSFEDKELLNKDEIEAKLKIKSISNTALNKVKRNYRIELYFGGVIALLFLVLMYFELDLIYRFIVTACTVIIFGVLLWFTWKNFQRIRKVVISAEQLKPTLLQTITDIERYVNFNKSNYTKFLLLPFALAYGMLIGLLMSSGEKQIAEIFTRVEIIKHIIILVVVSAIYIPFSQYINRKMYKQHLDELKQCIEDFEEIQE